jgi:hypothetical protein
MTMTNPSPERSPTGQLLKGHTAAPAGRPRKKRLPRSLIAEACSDEDMMEILRLGVADAKANPSGPWGHFFASRLWHPPKAMAPPVEFDLDTTDPLAAAQDVLKAMSTGVLGTDQAKDVLAGLASVTEIVGVTEMRDEMSQLRELLGKGG